jgi:MFS transporter, Spinster family, sphingosine-1-phosphate transporter
VGLLGSSPIFAEASKHYNAFRLIAVGLSVWTLAAAGCGFAIGAFPPSLFLPLIAAGCGFALGAFPPSPFLPLSAVGLSVGTLAAALPSVRSLPPPSFF